MGPNGNGIRGPDHELQPKPAKPTKRPPILPIFRRSNRRMATTPSRCPRTASLVGPNGNGIGGPDHELRLKPAKPTKRPPILPVFRRSNRRMATPASRCLRTAGPVGPNRNGIGGADHELRPKPPNVLSGPRSCPFFGVHTTARPPVLPIFRRSYHCAATPPILMPLDRWYRGTKWKRNQRPGS